jgi:hypothetical protein
MSNATPYKKEGTTETVFHPHDAADADADADQQQRYHPQANNSMDDLSEYSSLGLSSSSSFSSSRHDSESWDDSEEVSSAWRLAAAAPPCFSPDYAALKNNGARNIFSLQHTNRRRRRRKGKSKKSTEPRQQPKKQDSTTTHQQPKYRRLHSVVVIILIAQAAERLAYFGFRASLMVYFTQELQYPDTDAITLFAYCTFWANFTPICGAFLGDSKLGRFWTIVVFGGLYLAGLMVMTYAAFMTHSTSHKLQLKRIVTLIALALICTGAGAIKPCMNIFGADQVAESMHHDEQKHQNDNKDHQEEGETEKVEEKTVKTLDVEEGKNHDSLKAETAAAGNRTRTDQETKKKTKKDQVRTFFSYFSLGVNIGAVSSFLLIPSIKGHFGYGVAFLFPTAFLCMAVLLFLSQRNNYVYRVHNPHGSSLWTSFRLCVWLLYNNLWSYPLVAESFPSWLRPGPVPLPRLLVGPPSTTDTETFRATEMDESEDDLSSISTMTSSSSSRRGRSLYPDLASEHGSRRRSKSSSSARSPSANGQPEDQKQETVEWDENLGTQLEHDETSSRQSSSSLQTSDWYLAGQLSDAAKALNVLPVLAMLYVFDYAFQNMMS